MLYAGDTAVAGIVLRASPSGTEGYGRWVHYMSVEDVDGAEALIRRRGGRVLLAPQDIADRGDFAVVADPSDDAVFGLLRSTSGDPGDYRAEPGEWMWFQLFSRDAAAAATFYRSLVGYTVYDREDTPDIVDLLLERDGYSRASIGTLADRSDEAPAWLGFVRVADVVALVPRVRELGGEILYQSSGDRGDVAIIADPNGATLGLLRWQYRDDDAAGGGDP